MSPTKSRKPDSVLTAAEDAARAALEEEVGPDAYGEHVSAVTEGDRIVTHFFVATHPGYVGWRWAVTLTRAPRVKTPTVDEIVLLPGEEAVLAPDWVAWKDRVAPDDLGPGDLMPIEEDDPRLVPGYLVGDDALDDTSARDMREVIREVGLGRRRVLSVHGRDEAAQRWYTGDNGPDSPLARSAPGSCGTCGFMLRISGPMGTAFGVCANASSPSDGEAVSFDHGCGAHSDVVAEHHTTSADSPAHDTVSWEPWDIWGDDDVDYL